MSDSPILHGLNDAQRAAVTAGEGPHLILAGPGSGKTRVLTNRVAYLIQEMGVHPAHIVAVTFTNKAAREMKHRIDTMLAEINLSNFRAGTFHAICARIMRIEAEYTPYTKDYVIFDTRDQLDAVKKAALEINVDIKQYRPRSLLNAISSAKNDLQTPEVYSDNVGSYFDEVASRVYFGYRDILRASNAMDFDDLLMQTVDLLRRYREVAEKYQLRYRHVLVDEFQDTNFAQYKLVQALTAPQNNLFAVGDPDQSIYAFRGADHRNVLRLQRDYPDHQTILLEQNYRSKQIILDAAMAVIDHNPNRTPRQLFSDLGTGEPITLYEAYDEDDEGQFIVGTIQQLNEEAIYNPGDCAIMYRTNAQSRALEQSFSRNGMPYRLIGATAFYSRREIRDLMAYLRVVQNPDNAVGLERIINVPPRKIGSKTQQTLQLWANEMGLTLGQAVLELRDGVEAPLTPRARNSLETFADLLAGWMAMAEAGKAPLQILDAVLEETGYTAYIRDGSPEGEDRWENIMALREGAAEFNAFDLTTYLTEIALVSDTDTIPDEQTAPALMTLHSAKGLEYPVVFICGLEEGVLPHLRSLEAEAEGDQEALPEERRLMYVGLTRAKDRLYLSYAFRRSRFGDYEPSLPSRFLHDLPEELIGGSPLAKSSRAMQNSYARMTAWADDLPQPKSRQLQPRYSAGMRVTNPHFGEGVVIASKRYSDTEEVDVQFTDAGRKRIDGNYLEPLN